MEILRRVDSLSDSLSESRHESKEGLRRIEQQCSVCPARIIPVNGKMWTPDNLRLALILGLVIMLSTLGADGIRALIALVSR